jgi:hypothetical protein
VVTIIGQSGTYLFLGSGFWYHRDRHNFDTLNNIEKRSKILEPLPFLYNVYGGTLGGPIIKDRAFFFGSFQEITARASSLLQGGNPAIAPEGLQLLATIPGFSSNPALQLLQKASAFAVPNAAGSTLTARTDVPEGQTVTIGGVVIPVLFPQRVLPQPTNEPELIIRGDLKITDHHSVWYRHLWQRADNKNGLTSTGSAGNIGNLPVTSQLFGGTWTWQISNTAVNEVRFSRARLSVIFGGGCEGQFATCIPDPVANMGQTLPNISFTGIRSSITNTAMQTLGPATNLPQGRVVTSYQWVDNFSKTWGRHQFKMGADIRRLTNSVPFLPNVNGAFGFGGFAATPTTPAVSGGTALAQDRPTSVTLAAGQVTLAYNETDQFYYVQDDWRIKDNLTLNLGLRYEYTGQPINLLHDLSTAREANPATAIWKQTIPLNQRTYPKLPADNNNFAPRLGFAWRPNFGGGRYAKMLFGEQDKSVISGGYSIAYDPVFYNIMLNISTSSPLVFNNTTSNLSTGAITFPVPGPNGAAVQAFAKANSIIAVNTFDPKWFNQTNVDPNLHSPYAEQWSLRFQREINRTNVIEIRYVGTHGVSLFATHNGNPRINTLMNGFTTGGITFPGFPNLIPQGVTPLTCTATPGSPDNTALCNGRILPQSLIRTRDNSAQSIYHGLQTRYEGRLWNQFSFGAAYTWQKTLDNASEVFSFNDPSGAQNPFNWTNGERSYSQFDRRHTFTLNYIWDIPLFKNQSNWKGKLLGGWQFNGTYYIGTGQRFSALEIFNEALGALRGSNAANSHTYEDGFWENAFLGLDTLRPFYGNPNAPRTSVGISQIDAALIFGAPVADANGFYDFAALNQAKVVSVTKDQVRYIFNGPGAAKIFGTPFGNVPRNAETAPTLNNLNLGLFKNFKIRENIKLQLQATMFNALNHPNPAYGFIGSGGNGTPQEFIEGAAVSTPFNDYGDITFARRAVQFGVKIIF